MLADLHLLTAHGALVARGVPDAQQQKALDGAN